MWIYVLSDAFRYISVHHHRRLVETNVKRPGFLNRYWLLYPRAPEESLLMNCKLFIIYFCLSVYFHFGPGGLSRYNDSLRIGQSGDRIAVEARFSTPVQTDPEVHLASCTMGRGRGVALTTHPHLQPRLKKEYSNTSTPLQAFMACSRAKFTSPLRSFWLC